MHDAIKHTLGSALAAAGFVGSVTLGNVSQIVSIGCGLVGIIAGLCTISSWFKKRP